MKRIAPSSLLACGMIALALISVPLARSQEEPTLDAHQRLFPGIGAGLRAVRRGPDGAYYILTFERVETKRKVPDVRVPVVFVYDAQGHKLRQIADERDQTHDQARDQTGDQPKDRKHSRPPKKPPAKAASPLAANNTPFGALDVDASGRVYVADTADNSVMIYAFDGSLLAHLAIPRPTQIVALPHERIAISSAGAGHLITIYDFNGKPIREIGELADLTEDAALNHRLNAGCLAADRAGNLYFAFRYLPEPTVRKYDSQTGYLLDEFTLNTLDFEPMAQSARQEIARADSGAAINPHEIISALGLDPETQEFWLALGNLLLDFSNADAMLGSSRAYTKDGSRMVPNFILPEKTRLIMGADPAGIWEFSRQFPKTPPF